MDNYHINTMKFIFNITDYCKNNNIPEDLFIEALKDQRLKELVENGGLPIERALILNRDDLNRFQYIDLINVVGFARRLTLLSDNKSKSLEIEFVPSVSLQSNLKYTDISEIIPRILYINNTLKIVTFDFVLNNFIPIGY